MTNLLAENKTGTKLVYMLLLVIFTLQLAGFIGETSLNFAQAISPVLVYSVYIYVTLMYLVFSVLINLEIRTLEEFNVDRFTIVTFALASLIRPRVGLPGEDFFLILIRFAGIFVVFTLILKKPNIPRNKIRWVLIGVAISGVTVILITLFELAFRDIWKIMPLYRNNMFSTVSGEIIREFSFGSLIEEILFRGFLWGYL